MLCSSSRHCNVEKMRRWYLDVGDSPQFCSRSVFKSIHDASLLPDILMCQPDCAIFKFYGASLRM